MLVSSSAAGSNAEPARLTWMLLQISARRLHFPLALVSQSESSSAVLVLVAVYLYVVSA